MLHLDTWHHGRYRSPFLYQWYRNDTMVPFYDTSESERIARTEQAIRDGSTITERWSALAGPEAAPWNARAEAAAQWLTDEPAVLDLGCGTMVLEQYLPTTTKYYPCDVVARDVRTIVRDFNLDPHPRTGATAVACLGLLEYLHQPAKFMGGLARLYSSCVVSYCMTDAPKPLAPRRAHGWVNDFSRRQLEGMFASACWRVQAYRSLDDVQGLWRLHSSTRR